MGKLQYTQKFRKEWLQNTLFKDWLVAVKGDDCKGRCRLSKTEVNAKFYDIKQHAKISKHISATQLLSSSRSLTDFCKPPSIKVDEAEASLSLFIAVHCSILSIDYLGTLCHSTFGDSVAAKDFKLHRTKCTNIIINVFTPHFESSLKQSIGKNPYSLLIDESTDISVTKFLGITVIYFDREMGKTIFTYLSLVEITNCDAQLITKLINKSFESINADPCKLLSDLTNLVKSTVRKIVTPMCREDFLTVRIEDYLNLKPYLGYSFEKTVEDSNFNPESEKLLKYRCLSFILHLGK
jgi:hypothetical protein